MATKKTTAAVTAGKNTKTADDSKTNAAATITGTPTSSPSSGDTATEALTAPADIDPATEIDTSGSPQQIVPDVDLSHPAVDDNPRKETTVAQNKIDFNDPTISGQEAVERNLGLKKG